MSLSDADLLSRQDARQAEARRFVVEHRLDELLAPLGRVIPVGSAVTGLMVWRDLDYTVDAAGATAADVWDTLRPILHRAQRLSYADETGDHVGETAPYERHYFVFRVDGWKLDVSVWTNGAPEDIERYQHALVARLNGESRLAILRLKDAWHVRPEYPESSAASTSAARCSSTGFERRPSSKRISRRAGLFRFDADVPLTLRYVVADVFTYEPLTGNQLAVFTDGRGVDDATMQNLAREMNLSETVFVLPPEAGGHVRIRIFTPVAELPFAGHPTLGSAFVLAQPLQLVEIRLETGSGIVPVRLEREGAKITFGWMSQPLPTWRPYERADELLSILGVESELPVDWYDLGPSFVYVALRSADEVAALRPDFQALMQFESGVNCFAPIDGAKRWKTRMFAPSSGVYEDPATGSAAGPLGVHLLRHGRIASGDEIEIEQGAEIRRPSRLYVRVVATRDEVESVEVGGNAVVVARGEFRLP